MLVQIVRKMALLGTAFGGEVGLQLLLSPAASNIIVRTACVAVGVGLPVYSTFNAIERKDPQEQEQWLVYWAVYGCFSAAEIFSDKLLSWFPYYYHAKLVFLTWLQLPISNGARHCFVSYLRPFLLRHKEKLDYIVDGARNHITKFVLSHQQEIQFFKVAFHRLMAGNENTGSNTSEERTSNTGDSEERSDLQGPVIDNASRDDTSAERQSPSDGQR